MSIVDVSNVWVIANFKETQIGKMTVGQKVKIEVDAYKGKHFEGTIESFAGATGAKFRTQTARRHYWFMQYLAAGIF